jgi:hypothetical protein
MLNNEIQFNLFGRNWLAYWQVSEDNTKQYVRLRTPSKPRPTKEQYNAAMRYAHNKLKKNVT